MDQAAIEIDRLLSRIALADRAAFDALYALTAPRLFGVALKILPDRNDAEDVLQESFMKIWRRATLNVSSTDGAPLHWLVSIVRNTAIDWRRRYRAGAAELSPDLADDGPTPEASASARADARLLFDCIDTLAPEKADLIRKAYFGGLTYSDLSVAEGAALGTMKSWMRRSLLRLRQCMETGAPARAGRRI